MPYCTPEQKRDPNLHSVGKLTYDIQTLLQEYLEDAAGLGCKPEFQRELGYADLGECIVGLVGALIDFADRIVIPYEHRKRAENGDVWGKPLLDRLGIS